jgi:hypothetical protein
MEPILFDPEPAVANALAELTRITQMPLATLVGKLIRGTLSQSIESRDADLISEFIQGTTYPSQERAEAAAENFNRFVEESHLLHTPKATVANDEEGFWIEFVHQTTV